MKVADVVARLRATCPSFARIGRVLEPNAQETYPLASVARIKHVVMEQPPATIATIGQMTRAVFGVYVVLPKRGDTAGDPTSDDDLDDLCAELRASLVGWLPAGADLGETPLWAAGGELAELNGLAVWREDFAHDFDLRA